MANPRHAPITVALDLKDRLTDNPSFAQGNLARVNQELLEAFERLFAAEALGRGRWPTVDALRGRVIAVLSGDEETRLAYVRDPGHNPAVAINAAGRVVEVHDSGGGELWYWTGEVSSPPSGAPGGMTSTRRVASLPARSSIARCPLPWTGYSYCVIVMSPVRDAARGRPRPIAHSTPRVRQRCNPQIVVHKVA